MKNIFPFAAIVGQHTLKTALLASAVNPAIGGVLVRGDKGTAKSTTARALAAVMAPFEKVVGCTFNCALDAPLADCAACNCPSRQIQLHPAPFVNLPLGATEDRVIGSLDFEQALQSGKRAFQAGLLASAHQGMLYIDEVNLLSDHLVDTLLDTAASGINSIEREGITFSHPSSFVLVGTMNPEEGDLRPQLLDRFGLLVEVVAPDNANERADVVRRRLAFESDAVSFASHWQQQQEEMRHLISQARNLLPSVQLCDEQLHLISTLCTRMQVKSLRADIVINKTATTLAALAGRQAVTVEDIHQAAQLALPHRLRTRPGERSALDQQKLDELMEQLTAEPPTQQYQDSEEQSSDDSFDSEQQSQMFPSRKPQVSNRIDVQSAGTTSIGGRRSSVSGTARGAYVKAVKPTTTNVQGNIALDATVRHSVFRNGGTLLVEKEDIHIKQRLAKTSSLILFVVDASGSMAAMKRMSAVKGAVIALLEDAYQCRDTVGVVTFRGQRAELALAPTRSTDLAQDRLEALPTGGMTPLSDALDLASRTFSHSVDSGQVPLLVLLTDGKANIATAAGADPSEEALSACDRIRAQGIGSLVIDTENGYVLLGNAHNIAQRLGAEYVKLEELTSENLRLTVKSRLPMGAR